jgi:predicted GIY-YIG superfamily endonuclease
MSKSFNKIGEALNVETSIMKKEDKINIAKKPSNQQQDDYEYTRGQLYNLIEKGQMAVDGILDVAENSQHPRAYEVAGQLIKNLGDVTDKLMNLHKNMKDLDNKYQGPNNITNNALYVGSTADLMKMIKQSNTEDNLKK